ncbi:MAG: GH116 family glycosyl hydrolase [Candidatus Aminicenantes bacterium]|nr:GH116 family glycosyl hydrolase [Candidatus Aminicenantes bacterium]
MRIRRPVGIALGLILCSAVLRAGTGLVPRFALEPSNLTLSRPAQAATYFDKAGPKFAILGTESGLFEAWAYPLKLFRDCEFSFFIGSSTQPILGKDIIRFIDVTPAATTLTYVFQSFTVRATYVTSVFEPGAVILLAVDATEPLTIVCSFLPVLQPMWPAGIGGQYAYWDDEVKAYFISEPTRKNHGYLGSPAATGISYTPAHMLSDTPNQFKIAIDKPDEVKHAFIPVVMAGGKGARDDIKKVYEKLAASPEAVYREAAEHYRRLRAETLRISTPAPEIDLAFEWAKIAHDNLFVENPDLGKGMVAGLGASGTGGRPGFGWFFGGDAFMNSLSLDGYGALSGVKTALLFTQKWQRADGKMAHELSQAASYLKWFEDYPYAYIHGDTTPFYIVACLEYYRWSGDLDFISKSWPSIRKAYAWCKSTDADGDGLMDNSKAGLGALEFGELTGIKTDIFLAAAGARAAFAMREMARAVNDRATETAAAVDFAKARGALNSGFWNEGTGQYAYAFNADGRQVEESTPWSAVPIVWGLMEEEKAARALQRLGSADLTTDWGVRMLSNQSAYYEPLNYNYGAAWPFLTGWVAAAMYERNFVLQGYGLLRAAVRHTFDNGLGFVTELFSGNLNVWPQEGVAHQGFSSSGVVFPLLRGLLGLTADAPAGTFGFAPRFPADWNRVKVENIRVGDAVLDIEYRREPKKIEAVVRSRAKNPVRMTFAPVFGLGTVITAAAVNGRAVQPEIETKAWDQAVQPFLTATLTGEDVFSIEIEPTFEILPPENPTRTGETSRGLRVIRCEKTGVAGLKLSVEGLAGTDYFLDLTRPDLVGAVSGGAVENGRLKIRIPDGREDEYLRHTVILEKR